MVKQTWKGLQLSQKSTIREIGKIAHAQIMANQDTKYE
jgi:hypothetical protein